jgi:hypothetical protein
MVEFLTGCRKIQLEKKMLGSKAAFETSGYLKAETNFLKQFKEDFQKVLFNFLQKTAQKW